MSNLMGNRTAVVLATALLSIVIMACGTNTSDTVVTQQAPVEVASSDQLPVVEPTETPVHSDLAKALPTPTTDIQTPISPTSTVIPTQVPTATQAPTVVVPTPTAVPTTVTTPTPKPYVPNYVPSPTPTLVPPTPTPSATPIGYASFSGKGTADTNSFRSPPRLPWAIEWDAKGEGANTITVSLMDPGSETEVNEVINDVGNGPLGGVNLVIGNTGTFYLHIEGPLDGWTIWVRQQ